MRLSGRTEQHLSYCTNIHPGESLAEVRAALAQHLPRIKAAVSPDAPFGVGLRLSQAAAQALREPSELVSFRTWLDKNELYVFTLNGFPYGAFHGTRVKERVYEPDWRSPARVLYTQQLAAALAGLLPAGTSGSISTVPGAWKAAVRGEADYDRMAENLLQSVAHLIAIREQTGIEIALALEPEPGCVLETIDETVAFFERYLFSDRALAWLADLTGSSVVAAQVRVRAHLGVCLDACHAAVEFEDAAQLCERLARAGIGVKKLQLSSGLRVPRFDARSREALFAFTEDVYLHQTVARRGDVLTRYTDLPEALGAVLEESEAELRIHFHVPVFLERYGVLESTQSFLRELLAIQAKQPISRHLEVETYTWDVLPAELRAEDVSAAISRELEWVRSALQAGAAR